MSAIGKMGKLGTPARWHKNYMEETGPQGTGTTLSPIDTRRKNGKQNRRDHVKKQRPAESSGKPWPQT